MVYVLPSDPVTVTWVAFTAVTVKMDELPEVIEVGLAVMPTVGITANPTSITSGSSSILTVTAVNATQVTVTGSDGSTYTMQPSGGTQPVNPTSTTTYTATA